MRIVVLSAALLASLPLVLADGSSAYEHDGVHPGGVFLYTMDDRFRIDAVEGEVIRATLTWSDPAAHLMLEYTARPGNTGCGLTEAECIVDLALSTRCEGPRGIPTSSPYVHEITAEATGLYALNVAAELARDPVPYHLTIEVGSGGADRVVHAGARGPAIAFAHPVCAAIGP